MPQDSFELNRDFLIEIKNLHSRAEEAELKLEQTLEELKTLKHALNGAFSYIKHKTNEKLVLTSGGSDGPEKS